MSDFEISVDGSEIPVEPGQSLAAAMTAADITTFRRTRVASRPRGMFCGIGVCFECLVTVNGVPNVRACLEPAWPGDRVSTGEVTDV
ncbi:2Fe-2S iron-sulfur cluster protein [Stackebrandtia endophytica]|uniref:2Fe-2S iron-sulfur cluster protein n=1 Tax=Stackebrandtia endophytica TaxID=1496996 RepID=A0A543B4E1_9ACTN|nr:(2Fe-2S)-binding protein [Stackebrandtia endophytica]TQL79697.1 2Fe-2S iron-sulfur cluster protein [Stackebrandtia endophytica]